jgi:hypothetical protein
MGEEIRGFAKRSTRRGGEGKFYARESEENRDGDGLLSVGGRGEPGVRGAKQPAWGREKDGG